ncbi:phosphotransferase family protein [Rhizobium rhizogenes]|uniref:phosphotransferase family protein n=1 Tax=Rhizobium rhizogenes TaxID=359 RepID=UPI0015744B1C|nr:phosphotransferase [Rhizobium rhizogenes]NTF64942.1 phosphotransferase [Rhizobium rhizogenes]NTG96290.1 phosphotransferase [Rhizobium rhizogenes]
MRQAPDADLAAAIALRTIGCAPVAVRRFTTGSRHYVFDLQFTDRPSAVVRIGDPSARAEMAGAVYLSELLRPRGMPLPAILAQDLDGEFPWLLLERFPGTDLGSVISDLTEEKLDGIASRVACAQAIAGRTASAGQYGYAARPEHAAYGTWSQVLLANLARSRMRIGSAGLFDVGLVDAVQHEVTARRGEIDSIDATPFLHDTTTKNVIVTHEGTFSGIVDVDDLCFGDPRYPAALTLAALMAYGGPVSYVSAWLRHAGQADDELFRLYTSVLLLDLMAEHGYVFNGNETPSAPAVRATMQFALEYNLNLACRVQP